MHKTLKRRACARSCGIRTVGVNDLDPLPTFASLDGNDEALAVLGGATKAHACRDQAMVQTQQRTDTVQRSLTAPFGLETCLAEHL